MTLRDEIEGLVADGLNEVEAATDLDALERVRVTYLGRKGSVTTILRRIPTLSEEEKREIGRAGNEAKTVLEAAIDGRRTALEQDVARRRLADETFDISLPGKRPTLGRRHLITSIIDEVVEIFLGLGYSVVDGPEVELDYYNFTALNLPPYHPARSNWDTFYISGAGLFDEEVSPDELHDRSHRIALLRTHTSPVQVRVMERSDPPVYVIAPGKCYRRDIPDATHSPMFFQIEGLAVDEGITFTDLKGTLELFAHELFGVDANVRFRASYFPFTEPSAEMDVSCVMCAGSGCRVCKDTGWLEILGAGMVNPAVLEEVGYDAERYTGFAFGMGVERIAMLRHGIPDIRMFFENDLRFVRQF